MRTYELRRFENVLATGCDLEIRSLKVGWVFEVKIVLKLCLGWMLLRGRRKEEGGRRKGGEKKVNDGCDYDSVQA